jgi:AbrB family looped-hinge helix DNA binding protein
MNDRGQIVIPEEIRKDLGLDKNTTLVLIDDGEKIFIQKEADVFTAINEDNFWKGVSRRSLLSLWDKKDEVWDKFVKGV